MRLAHIKSNEGWINLYELENRNGQTVWNVSYWIKGQVGTKDYTYKKRESALRKYKKVADEMCKMYMEKCK